MKVLKRSQSGSLALDVHAGGGGGGGVSDEDAQILAVACLTVNAVICAGGKCKQDVHLVFVLCIEPHMVC